MACSHSHFDNDRLIKVIQYDANDTTESAGLPVLHPESVDGSSSGRRQCLAGCQATAGRTKAPFQLQEKYINLSESRVFSFASLSFAVRWETSLSLTFSRERSLHSSAASLSLPAFSGEPCSASSSFFSLPPPNGNDDKSPILHCFLCTNPSKRMRRVVLSLIFVHCCSPEKGCCPNLSSFTPDSRITDYLASLVRRKQAKSMIHGGTVVQ